jgi:NH3-dependent NAD+ synthetase
MLDYRNHFLSEYPTKIFQTAESLCKLDLSKYETDHNYAKYMKISIEKIHMEYDLSDAYLYDMKNHPENMKTKQVEDWASKRWEKNWNDIEKFLHVKYGIPIEKKASLK